MMTEGPQPSPSWPELKDRASKKSALVGGLPWASAAGDAPPPLVTTQPIKTLLTATLSIDSTEQNIFSLPALRARMAVLFRKSPAWTVSLSVHIFLLFVLALAIVPIQKPEHLRLDMSFSLHPGEQSLEEEGLQITPTLEEVSRTEIVEPELPVVEEPIAAPPTIPVVSESGTAATPAPAIAIGSALNGREPGQKKSLLGTFGGGDATESAVGMALEWLTTQQRKDGLWSLIGPYADGGSQENRLAATAVALLAFQGAGNTMTTGPHRVSVANAWRGLLTKQTPEGNFDAGKIPSHHSLYSHAQVTIALCEIYGMTKDESFAQPAAQALAFAIAAQGPNGAWRYEPGKDGDMSVTGWFLMALKSAQMAGIAVPQASFDGISRFLDTVANDNGTRYGYRRDNAQRPAGPITAAISAEGLLCRQYLGWTQDDPRLAAGIELLIAEKPFDYENDKDVYAWYYITQVTHNLQGDAWTRWNERLRDVLPRTQILKGREKGSLDSSLDKWGHHGGRLFVTCMCTFMLESYYRHLPVYANSQLGN